MNTVTRIDRKPGASRRCIGLGSLTALALSIALSCPAIASTSPETKTVSPMEQAVASLRAEYRQQQWSRLAQKQDRDSLIAAVLLGLPDDSGRDSIEGHNEIEGHDAVEQHLAQYYGHDATAMFALTLACQVQHEPCTHPEYYDELVRIAPDNAVHWLLLPNGAAPNDAQLHSAAAASSADSHASQMMGILRTALDGQPAPAGAGADVDAHELALSLRRDAVDQVALPLYSGVISVCKPTSSASHTDCIAVGRRLYNDRSGSIVTRMIGSVILRRLEKGSSDDVQARQLRRDYVWMSERLDLDNGSIRDPLQRDTIRYGEWSAWQRAVERTGTSPRAPSDWVPKNPQTLLMSEERTPAPAAP